MALIERRKTIFDILKEAEDDGVQTNNDPAPADNTEEAPSPEESGEDAGGDDDFDLDVSMDDDGGDNGDGEDSGDDSGSSSGSSDLGGGLDDEDKVDETTPEDNNIFSSLTPEEQQRKIEELRNLFGELYTSTDDTLERINQIPSDEDNIDILTRVSMTLYSIRQYLLDYITKVFSTKSYIENDIFYNRFLAMINGIATVIEELGSIKKEKIEKSDKK